MHTTDEIRVRRTHPVATAPLILFGLLFVGLTAIVTASDVVPSGISVLMNASAFYAYTVMGGVVLSFLIFGAAGLILRRRPDPRIGWLRIGFVCVLVLTAAIITCGVLGLPALALGLAVVALGSQIALLVSAPQTRMQTGAYLALIGVALVMVAMSGWLVALSVQEALSGA